MKIFVILSIFFIVNASAETSKFKYFKLLEGPKTIIKKALSVPELVANSFKEQPDPLITIGNGEDNPFYTEISEIFEKNYQSVGKEQTDSILKYNNDFKLGKLNYPGFEWVKPYGHFGLSIKRELSPDLFDDDRWIVRDQLIIQIDAQNFLKKLMDDDSIDISEENYKAFAGISFERTYTYTHFEKSYADGLLSDFRKLFFSFTKFRNLKFVELSPYEFISKKDTMIMSAGGIGTIPLGNGLSASAAGIAKLTNLSKLDVRSYGEDDQKEKNAKFAITVDRSTVKTLEFQSSIQGEFFKLIRITLLSYEYEFSNQDSNRTNLIIYNDDIGEIKNKDSAISKAITNIFKLKDPDFNVLKNNITSSELREKEDKKSKYRLLLFGKKKHESDERIIVNKDGVVSTIYRHTSGSTKFKYNFFYELVNSISNYIFNVNTFDGFDYYRSRKLKIDYRSKINLMEEDELLNDATENLALNFEHEFFASDVHGYFNEKYLKYTYLFANNYTKLDADVLKNLRNKNLKGPLTIYVRGQITPAGVDYFTKLDFGKIRNIISIICSKETTITVEKICIKKLGNKHDDFALNSSIDRKDIALKSLKEFLLELGRWSTQISDLDLFFNSKNIFIGGSFESKTKDDKDFMTYFRRGVFKGDNFFKFN